MLDVSAPSEGRGLPSITVTVQYERAQSTSNAIGNNFTKALLDLYCLTSSLKELKSSRLTSKTQMREICENASFLHQSSRSNVKRLQYRSPLQYHSSHLLAILVTRGRFSAVK